MRKARILVLLLLVVIGVHVAIFGLHMGWIGPLLKDDASHQTAEGIQAERDKLVRPTFDIMRAEPSGDVVMAGRSEPGWTVTVESNGKTIGSVVADGNGEWVIQPAKPLPAGEHALELKAQDPKNARTLFSKQRIALSLSQPGKDRPLVALTEEGKPTRVLQMPPQAAAELAGDGSTLTLKTEPGTDPSKRVSFAAVDYEEAGPKSMLHLAGQATPGARIILYIENEFAGTATADATGKWTYSGTHELRGSSTYALRADMVDGDTSKVAARAEVRFDREPRQALAMAENSKPGLATASNGAEDKSQVERAIVRQDAGAGAGTVLRDSNGQVIVVRRGDTLWHIAHRYYGSGAKYTQIFENNRAQIRNPDLIYPSQRFSVPSK